jgi:ribA/ribD-fused uncharacterized protein
MKIAIANAAASSTFMWPTAKLNTAVLRVPQARGRGQLVSLSYGFPDLPDVQLLIAQQTSAMAAKMRSKPHRSSTREDWTQIRVRVMRWVLRVKLAQHMNGFGGVLLSTGDSSIVERSTKDRYWGAIESQDGTLEGENVLGRLLMALREELRTRSRDELSIVAPPRVDHFLLVGRPVGIVRYDDIADSRHRAVLIRNSGS